MTGGAGISGIVGKAAAALSSGDAAGALARLRDHLDAGGNLDRRGLMLMAQAASRAGDADAERAALHRLLGIDRRDLPALLAMGENHARGGDDRAAVAWFTAALRQAAAAPPPTALAPLLDRAQRFCADAQHRFARHLESATGDLSGAGASPALRHALDLLHGRAELFLQQPGMFYYPGLPQRAFYERGEFPWVADIEARAEGLRDEFLALLREAEPFAPYIQRPASRPASSSPLLDDPDWGAAYLWQAGEPVAATASRCPLTMAALALAPQPVIPARSPMALWSRLKPGTHIAPHHGLLNTRLICHLPLVAPPGCALRVGHETREWRFGEMLIFDDSVEHEAWNRGKEDRTVLLFEVWRPEIPDDDRAALARLFAAIDTLSPPMDEGPA